MGKLRKNQDDPDRFLYQRNGKYYYHRRVPKDLVGIDERGVMLYMSLKTNELAKARRLRDKFEQADNELWAGMLRGHDSDASERHYLAAVSRAKALGFPYEPQSQVFHKDLLNVVQRIEAPALTKQDVRAAMGTISQPEITVTRAFEIYLQEIAPHEISGKSEGQKKRWRNGKQQSIDSFVEEVGDPLIGELDRTMARKYYDFWLKKIAPASGKATHTASIGNRRFGDLRVFYREYFTRLGEPDRQNPFEKLSFREKKRRVKKRPPFPHDWIINTILKSEKLQRMNEEARGVMLVVADIGARPSEICNLTEEMIVLNARIPHLKIEPRDDPDDPREIKTESSVRIVPLQGLALEVMKRHPKGFPKYKDKESSLSAAVNKFMRENGLYPTERHVLYSFRHSFEDRMKEARIDGELRNILMGHAIDRPEYGEGGSLKLRLEEIKKVALPCDPSIV